MNNALWLCLQTNRLAFYQEPTARFFELAFRPANTNVCQKRKKNPTHSFFIIHLPLWTVRLKHTSKCRRALFFNFILVFFFYMQFTTSRVLPVEPRTELYSRMHTKHTAHSAAPRLLLVTQCFLTPCLEWSTEQLINQCWEVSHPSKHMADCLWNILKATRSIQQPLKAHGAISL